MDNSIITPRQLMILIIYFIVGTTILVVPSSLAAEAKQNAWMLELGGSLCGLLMLWFYTLIYKRNPGQSLFQMNEQLLGRITGKATNLLIALLMLLFCAQVLYYVGSFIKSQIMQETPMIAIHVLFMAALIIGTRSGLTAVIRTSEIYFPWILLLFVLFVLFILPETKINQLLPVSEISTMSLARGTLQVMSYAILPLFIPFGVINTRISWQKPSTKAFLYGGMVSGIILVILVLMSIMVLGPSISASHLYPTYDMARKINIGHFLQRVEVITAFLWFVFIYFKLLLYFLVLVEGTASLFQMTKQTSTLATPLGIFVIILSVVVYPNYEYQQLWDSTTWVSEAILLGFLYPGILLFISIYKQRKSKPSSGATSDKAPSSQG